MNQRERTKELISERTLFPFRHKPARFCFISKAAGGSIIIPNLSENLAVPFSKEPRVSLQALSLKSWIADARTRRMWRIDCNGAKWLNLNDKFPNQTGTLHFNTTYESSTVFWPILAYYVKLLKSNTCVIKIQNSLSRGSTFIPFLTT